MNLDDPVCLCFHVSKRKVVKFIQIEKPRRPSQLSECFGAGTGCGWCRPYLERILAAETDRNRAESTNPDTSAQLEELSSEDYARQRSDYVREGGGTPPPGAMPIDPPNE